MADLRFIVKHRLAFPYHIYKSKKGGDRKMKKSVLIVVLFSFVFLISSCATLFKGTRQEVSFNSNPQKAEVWVNGAKLGETPVSLKLESKKDHTIEFKMEGF
jgi:PEGA domain